MKVRSAAALLALWVITPVDALPLGLGSAGEPGGPAAGPLGWVQQDGGEALAAPRPPAPAIEREAIQRHVEVLASDALEGRLAGTESTRRASQYLARVLEAAGVEPGGWTETPGEEGASTWFQSVPLVRQEFGRSPSLVLADAEGAERAVEYGVEFLLSPAGPDRVRGPLRIVQVHGAQDLPEERGEDTALLFHTGRSDQRRILEEAGHPDGEGLGLVLRAAGSKPGRPSSPPRGGRLRLADPGAPSSAPGITLRGPASDEAARWVSATLDPGGGDVPAPDRNVVGVIRGTGTPEHPELAREVVVLSAHFDHIGVGGADDAEDRIRNGADDDASGCAVLLELAEALVAEPPVRTVVILLATAEEQGILGTRWFVEQFPLERVVCNLNFEMLGRPDPEVGGAGKLWLTGYERSNLGPMIAAAGTGVLADPRPEQSFFTRSDNIVFVQEGIVGQTLSTYNMHRDYHQVTDEAGTLDYAHMEAAARACLVAVRAVVDGEASPAWLPGEPKLGR
jgi:hypothetical protein